MRHTIWVLCLLTIPSVALAGEWDKLMTDIDLFKEQMEQDAADITDVEFDAGVEGASELFPVFDGEEDVQEASISDTHVAIKVHGVSVVLHDVPITEWFAVYVRDAAERGYVSGYTDADGRPSGLYGPADTVTIEQVAKMAVLAAGLDPYVCGQETKNTSALGNWSSQYIGCAEQSKWAVFSDASVDVTRPATRAEVIITVLQAYRQRVSPVSGTIFTDVTRQTIFGNAIETAALAGIISGYSDDNGNPTGLFGPADSVNRAETAKIFSLAGKRFGK